MPKHALKILTLGLTSVLACSGDSATTPTAALVEVYPDQALITAVAGRETFLAVVTDASGETIADAHVSWTTHDAAVATVDGEGRVTATGVGETVVTATADGASDEARLVVYVPEHTGSYEPGVVYYGREGYTEYRPGELPLILSAPHGGDLEPGEISDRTVGTVVTDSNTREMVRAMREALITATGYGPHVVISNLRRTKLDPNREIVEAAQGSPFAELAWEEYHDFIQDARAAVVGAGNEGLYLDIHGHGHAIERVELGYLLTAAELNGPDQSLNNLTVVMETSIRELGRDSPIPFSQLLRGPTSFGGLLETEGIAAVPSPAFPSPGSDPYFTGGYSTLTHGSLSDSELVSGIQVELHRPGVRDSPEHIDAFAAIFARVVEAFMLEHIGHFAPQGVVERGPRG